MTARAFNNPKREMADTNSTNFKIAYISRIVTRTRETLFALNYF